jgi:Copper binding periplasmic protein CusF
MNSLRDTLRISFAGLAIGAFALGGCVETSSNHDESHSEHDDHAHGDDGHDHAHDHGDGSGEDTRVDLYEGILGEIAFLPEAGDTKRYPKIHHVQIPTFKKDDGTIAMTPDGIPGMKSMTMEFPLAEGVSVEGFAVGDKVMFDFAVNWGGRVAWEMTKIEKIDSATEIDFSNIKAENLEP